MADKGIKAARRYAKVAPDAPHALHMPSHIFTRVGYWQESIDFEWLRGVAKAAGDFPTAARHGLRSLCLSAARAGRESQGRDRRDDRGNGFQRDLPCRSLRADASLARFAVERGDWKAAAALEVRPSPLPQIQAITCFARAWCGSLGRCTRRGRDRAARRMRDALVETKDAYWADQVDIQAQVATAWVLFAGRKRRGLAAMSAAADAEDKTEKSRHPGPARPARDLWRHAAREGMAADALAASRPR